MPSHSCLSPSPRQALRAVANAPSAAYVASLEIVGIGHIARERVGLGDPHDLATLSHVALVEAIDPAATNSVDHLLPTYHVGGIGSIGLYFESYGADSTGATVSISVRRENRNIVARLFGRLFGRTDAPAVVSWHDPAREDLGTTSSCRCTSSMPEHSSWRYQSGRVAQP